MRLANNSVLSLLWACFILSILLLSHGTAADDDLWTELQKGGKVVLMQPPERYINHSCDPNSFVKTIDGVRHVLALLDIADCPGSIGQWVDPIDDRGQFPGLGQVLEKVDMLGFTFAVADVRNDIMHRCDSLTTSRAFPT